MSLKRRKHIDDVSPKSPIEDSVSRLRGKILQNTQQNPGQDFSKLAKAKTTVNSCRKDKSKMVRDKFKNMLKISFRHVEVDLSSNQDYMYSISSSVVTKSKSVSKNPKSILKSQKSFGSPIIKKQGKFSKVNLSTSKPKMNNFKMRKRTIEAQLSPKNLSAGFSMSTQQTRNSKMPHPWVRQTLPSKLGELFK